MAAVAAEPGAVAVLTTTAGDCGELEPVPAVPGAKLDSDATQQYAPVIDLVHQLKDGDAVQECSQVQMELVSRPDQEAAGKVLAACAEDEHIDTGCLMVGVENTDNHSREGYGSKYTMSRAERLKQFFSPNVDPANELSKHEPYACHQNSSISDSQPSVVFLHSFPAHPVTTEAGLSLAEPAEPMTNYYQNTELTQPTIIECDYRALIKPSHEAELEPESADDAPSGTEYKAESSEDASLEHPQSIEHVDSLPVLEKETLLGTPMETGYIYDFLSITNQNSPSPELPVMAVGQVPSSAELGDSCSRQRSLETNFHESETVLKPPHPVPVAETEEVQSESVDNLIPGSEVRVSLDHIIDDALVVSFRLGEKIFSGVLMDLSKRFGPYGIPITVFPKREYKDKPESMQLKTETFQPEKVEKPVQENPDSQVIAIPEPNPDPQPKPNPWTSKPPPLFQEGAPYPPPLFIRDTYNQSLPQPPPRKIKRPKRRLYREEPTSIMNAIKLRPRQVLCDKCKGTVMTVDKREPRRGPVSDSRGEDAKRRRNDSAATVSKRPRNEPRSEEKRHAAEVSKRQASGIRVSSSSSLGQVKGGAGGNRVLRTTSTTTTSPVNSSSRVQLNAKKVLQSKNVDHSKAREVLKLAKAQKRQREATVVTGSSGNAKTMTRAAALQEAHAHQKVHFTRRLQQISGVGPSNATPLPPRMRIKPQRYRNEENDSSTCKPPCLEKVLGSGSLSPPKLGAPRCTSTRSSSSSCSTGEATAAENQGPDKGPEPELSPQTQSQPQVEPLTATEHSDPKVEPEEQGGREERRETRGSKTGNLVVYMTLNPSQPDSSNTSMCSIDSADDLKSSNSECSSTETFDFPPPGDLHSPPAPGTSSAVTDTSPAPTEEKTPRKSQKVFSKNVSKCVSLDGRSICVGDIVWAKIYGFPWWPARVLGIQISRKDNGLLVRQEARVAWFGSPTTSFLALAQVAPFLESFQSRFDKKRKGLYRKAITEAAKAAKQLTPEVRALLTQFET
ncbi:PWWP domain-containing protein 2A [Salvelinus fontinalis]|uniref:PWWP domain-containing protein 2A n=1 Tax=Salvelinus fontinalis TaxID=8038 RepID=UPI002485DF20|nr:PWWP domain-containing protein 2A [Salvelinus fontinalis]